MYINSPETVKEKDVIFTESRERKKNEKVLSGKTTRISLHFHKHFIYLKNVYRYTERGEQITRLTPAHTIS